MSQDGLVIAKKEFHGQISPLSIEVSKKKGHCAFEFYF